MDLLISAFFFTSSLVGGGFGLAFVLAQCGMCLSAVSFWKNLLQCGHYTFSGSFFFGIGAVVLFFNGFYLEIFESEVY